MNDVVKNEYNERLFSHGVRKKLHEARFYWLRQQLKSLIPSPESVLELGCFDAKTLHYLPQKPLKYVGLDANWENGLVLAKQAWREYSNYQFFDCKSPEDIKLEESFTISICMETLEHVNPELVHGYLEKLAQLTSKYLFITVPNEKGVIFAIKHLIKKISRSQGGERYTSTEFFNAFFGRMDKIERQEHKGFDYQKLIMQVENFFTIKKISALPFGRFLPHQLGFQIGIVAEKK